MNEERKKVLIIGVIGADVHAVGNKILYHAFTEAGFDVVNLGVMVSQEEYIEAAIEADADADLLLFSPENIRENGTYAQPGVCASGFDEVFVLGQHVIENGGYRGGKSGEMLGMRMGY